MTNHPGLTALISAGLLVATSVPGAALAAVTSASHAQGRDPAHRRRHTSTLSLDGTILEVRTNAL